MNGVSQKSYTLDDFAQHFGKFGRYQIFLVSAIGLLIAISEAYSVSYVFTAGNVKYRCQIPECDDGFTGDFEPEWLKNAVPFSDNKPESCVMFKYVNKTEVNSEDDVCSVDHFDQNYEEDCVNMFYEDYETTITNEFNITCEEKWKLTLVPTMHNTMFLINLLVTGTISDHFGRKTVFIMSAMCGSIIGVIKSFAWNYWSFLGFQIIESLTEMGLYTSGYILAVETIHPETRSYVGPTYMIISTIGYVFMGGVAWITLNWRKLIRVVNSMGLVIVFYYWIIPESSRWLLSRGKYKEVSQNLSKIIKINKVVLPDDMKDVLENRPEFIKNDIDPNTVYDKNDPEKKIVQILKYPKMCLWIVACAICWAASIMVYYGLSYTSVDIGGNKFMNYILVSLADTPGQIITFIYVDRIGRRKLLIITFFTSGVALMIAAFIGDIYWLRLLLFLIGKCSVGSSFSAIYIFTSEFLPTFARHRLFGICSSVGRLGSIVASQALLLQDIYAPLPAIIFATMSLIAGCLSFVFPETVNCPLPDTIAEAMELGKSKNSNVDNNIKLNSCENDEKNM